MNTELENIIRNHDYSALNAEQLSLVSDWVKNEEEYSVMRKVIVSAPMLNEDVAPSPELKTSLMSAFQAANHTPISEDTNRKKVIFMWGKGAAAVAAVALLIWMIYPLMNSVNEEVHVAKTEIEEVKSKPKVSTDNNPTEEVQEPIENIVESQERMASNENTNDVTSIPNVTMEPTIRNDFSTHASRSTVSSIVDAGASFVQVDEAMEDLVFDHSDRITIADLPESSKQVVQENPELLNLLYTSF